MKPKSSCQLCRRRHRRCITKEGATRCNGCDELDKDCEFSPKFQFRPGKKTSGNGQGHSSKLSEGFSDEDRDLSVTTSNRRKEVGTGKSVFRVQATQNARQKSTSAPSVTLTNEARSESLGACSSPSNGQPTPYEALDSPKSGTPPQLTQREAYLFRSWVQKISFVSDAVDEARQFGVIVSKMALNHPILMHGILALASRVNAVGVGSKSDLESTYYHSRCIELLIDALSKPTDTYNSILLTAVVISRLYEENDLETDSKTYHLAGTRTLLSSDVVTRLTKEGGLAEAACWVHLRQAIYIAIVHRRHMDIPLGVYESLKGFKGRDDTSYANRAVYIFAEMLQHFFPDYEAEAVLSGNDNSWTLLERKLENWFEDKPSSFEPLFSEPADVEAGKLFPSMWMVSMVQTVALQHYYSSMIILYLRKCNESHLMSGFEAARLRRQNEQTIASYLCILMGLASSNEEHWNAWYLPCHMLDLCGYCIRNPVEREHTIQYLETVKQKVQWKTAPVMAALKTQWAELD